MKQFKSISTILGVFVGFFCFFLSANLQAQEAKVIEIKALNSMSYNLTNIVVKPGQKVTIRLSTVSEFTAKQMSHNWVLLKQTADVKKFVEKSEKYAYNDYIAPDMEDQVIAHTKMAAGGETVEVTFIAPKKPSKYMFLCTYPGHFYAGMKGTLTVKE